MFREVAEARARLQAAAETPLQRDIARRVAASGLDDRGCRALLVRVTEAPESLRPVREAAARAARDWPLPPGAFEQFLLCRSALESLSSVTTWPVPDAVKEMCAKAYGAWADGAPATDAPRHRFAAAAKLATLRRLPAGLFDWERSGLPRSWLPRVRPLGALARTLYMVGRWRGFGPALFAHLTVCRPVSRLDPGDANHSYYLMAKALELQPEIKGFLTSAWFHSPDTFGVSPHLAGLNRIFEENGGIVATIGPAELDCGVFHRSHRRRRAFEKGTFKPTLGLVIWSREEMIAWAQRHGKVWDWDADR